MRKFLILMLTFAAALLGAQSGLASGPPLERGAKVRVMKFTCAILPAEYAHTAELLSELATARVIAGLGASGIAAEPEGLHLSGRPAYNPALFCQDLGNGKRRYVRLQNVAATQDEGGTNRLMEPAPGNAEGGRWKYKPLVPEQKVVRTATGGLMVGPLEDSGAAQGAAPHLSEGQGKLPDFSAPTEFEEVTDPDTQVVPTRSTKDFGAPQPDALAQVSPEREAPAEADAAPQPPRAPEPDTAWQKLTTDDVDYILVGQIAYIHTEFSPTIKAGRIGRASIRAELHVNYKLYNARDGSVAKGGSVKGEGAQVIAMSRNRADDEYLLYSITKSVNSSVDSAADGISRALAGADNAPVDPRSMSDEEYYRDSPGKRLKP